MLPVGAGVRPGHLQRHRDQRGSAVPAPLAAARVRAVVRRWVPWCCCKCWSFSRRNSAWSIPARVREHDDGPGTDGAALAGGLGRGGTAGGGGIVAVDLGLPCGRPGGGQREVERLPPGVDQDQEVVVEQRRAVGGPVGVVGCRPGRWRWPARSGPPSRRRSSGCPPGVNQRSSAASAPGQEALPAEHRVGPAERDQPPGEVEQVVCRRWPSRTR